jgi:hypothetical protein
MRVLLRCKTGLFYETANLWTVYPEQAMDFKRILAAIEFAQFARLARLDGLEVVLSFGDPRYDIGLPLLETQPDSRPTRIDYGL